MSYSLVKPTVNSEQGQLLRKEVTAYAICWQASGGEECKPLQWTRGVLALGYLGGHGGSSKEATTSAVLVD